MAYSEGIQTVYNDDGSTTTITVEHVPPYEPMSRAQVALWSTVGIVGSVLAVGFPLALVTVEDRVKARRDLKDRQKKNQEIFHQLKTN